MAHERAIAVQISAESHDPKTGKARLLAEITANCMQEVIMLLRTISVRKAIMRKGK
ncbi:hypothetical protein [Pseudoduganella buxea]|uniref:Uncharacterized protein n=1 Tax=Pseudoduganella buxea TaxID=1949069 RepID=A0A6I3T2F4_9BURK|nr:hypothetical protein [Pseudoduganella buxea]MTV55810.1 hypothetical protein [Pseudoduganella buxea]